MGAKVLTRYALLGQYDLVNIVEAPSDEVAAKVATKLSTNGAFQPMTLAAIPVDKLIETLKKGTRPHGTPENAVPVTGLLIWQPPYL